EGVPSDSRVIAACVIKGQGPVPHTGISVAACICKECSKPDTHVFVSCGVVKERLRANACALIAVNVLEQRLITDCGVLVANRVVEQRLDTNTHVPHSSGDIKEGILAHRSVLPSADTGRVWTPCFERRRERKPAERNY